MPLARDFGGSTVTAVYGKEACMKTLMKSFLHNESGVTAIEYGLIAALVAVAGVTAFSALGTQIGTTMTSVKTSMAGS
jgi:pilus assembly protein Flp/PilA